MPNEQLMGFRPHVARQKRAQVDLHLVRIALPREAQAVGQPPDVRIDRKGGSTPQMDADDAGAFSADPGKGLQLGPCHRHPPAVLADERSCHRDDALRLAAVEAARLDVPLQLSARGARIGLRRGVASKKGWRHHVDPAIGALGRKDDRYQELKRRSIAELDFGVRHVRVESSNHRASPLALGRFGF